MRRGSTSPLHPAGINPGTLGPALPRLAAEWGQGWGQPWGQPEGGPGALPPAPAPPWHRAGAGAPRCRWEHPQNPASKRKRGQAWAGKGAEQVLDSIRIPQNITLVLPFSCGSSRSPKWHRSPRLHSVGIQGSPGTACEGWGDPTPRMQGGSCGHGHGHGHGRGCPGFVPVAEATCKHRWLGIINIQTRPAE